MERATVAPKRAKHTSDLKLEYPSLLELLWLCNNAREDDREQYVSVTGKSWSADSVAAECHQSMGYKYLLLDERLPIVAGGYVPVVNGVYQSWMVGAEGTWLTHWRSITKVSRRVMDFMFEEGATRLQTIVLASRTDTRHWYEKGLRLRFEGYMPGWGKNGETIAMYARVKE